MSQCHLGLVKHADPVIKEGEPGLFVVENFGEGEYGFFEGRPTIHQNADGTRVPYVLHPDPRENWGLDMHPYGGCK